MKYLVLLILIIFIYLLYIKIYFSEKYNSVAKSETHNRERFETPVKNMEIMNTRLQKLDTYSLENLTGLSKRCDWFINGDQLLKINEGNPRIIFLTAYRGHLGITNLVNNLLSTIKNNFVLIIASEDYTFPNGKGDSRHHEYKNSQDLIKILVDSPLLNHIFVENLDTPHPKMSPIPLGILENNVNIFDDRFYNIDFSKKTNLCLVRNRTYDGITHWYQFSDRKKANLLAKNEWNSFVKYIDYEISNNDFIEELKNSVFCLCIHGGGYDPCPKFFECILYGTIPIIQHSPLDEVFSKFPVVYIDDLEKDALSEDFLIKKSIELKEYYDGPIRNDVLKLLTLDYWFDIIVDKVP
jgi:hypothetical protein